MRSDKKKRIILTIAFLSIVIISTTIIYAANVLFVPLKINDHSSDNIDDDISYSPEIDEKVENIRTEGIHESPIYIDDTSTENNWEWASTQPWCSGSGTGGDPYRIQNLIIDGGGSGNGILIENSNFYYFIIDHCEIYNAISGIELSNTNRGIILENTVNKSSIGIYLHSSTDIIVSGNIVSYNQFHGILLQDSHYFNVISGNTAHHNWIGIYLSYSNDNTVSGNHIYMNWIGIVLQNSNDNYVLENVAMYLHGYGIRLIGSNYNIIVGNVAVFISEYGIHLNYSSDNTGTGNILRKTGAGKYYEDSKCEGNEIGYS